MPSILDVDFALVYAPEAILIIIDALGCQIDLVAIETQGWVDTSLIDIYRV